MAILTQVQQELTQWIHVLTSASSLAYASAGAGVFFAVLYFKIIFRDFHGFRDSLDGMARWGGRWVFGAFLNWEALKFVIWVLLSVGAGVLAYCRLPVMFPQWFRP